MLLCFLLQIAATVLLASATTPTKTVSRRNQRTDADKSRFVSTKNGQFFFNGSVLNFVGTNAYWLAALNTEDDIDFTLGNMSAKGIKVVRTWAFNDVETIPDTGTWFQLISNGTTVLNHGPNGLPKLDAVVRLAQKHGIFLQLSLTNNWNPGPSLAQNATGIVIEGRDVTPGANKTLPRNTLSNDYGGMDAYVRQLGSGNLSTHDEFYTSPVIQAKFKDYITNVVSRYVNMTSVFGWEIANDPRCNSTLQASSNCNTMTVTDFHTNITAHIKSVDPNHLVTSGSQGFLCMDCTKVFPQTTTMHGMPSASPVPSGLNRIKPLTKRKLLDDRKAAFKKSRALKQKVKGSPSSGMLTIRGRWKAPETKRQAPNTQDLGPAFDGSSGVDSQDIINVPGLDFGTFQLFPDQNSYGMDDPNLPPFNNTVNQGLAWIQMHAALGKASNKPIILNGFGLVTQNNSQSFVPFNSSQAPFASDSNPEAPFGVTDQQEEDAYTQWIEAGLKAGLLGMLQYQWQQSNLTTEIGTAVSPTTDGTGVSGDGVGTTTGGSPNDGYAFQGQGFDSLSGIIQIV